MRQHNVSPCLLYGYTPFPSIFGFTLHKEMWHSKVKLDIKLQVSFNIQQARHAHGWWGGYFFSLQAGGRRGNWVETFYVKQFELYM